MGTEQPEAGQLPNRRFGVFYDFRNPPAAKLSMPEPYSEVLDQIAWSEVRAAEHYRMELDAFIRQFRMTDVVPRLKALA